MHAELTLEIRNCVGADVARPVEHVESWAFVAHAAARACEAHQKQGAPCHDSRRRSDTTIKMPRPTTIIVEIAFTTGLAPRRAIA